MEDNFDIVIIGAGSGGLTAAAFAARLGIRVALIEKHRVGGDCTWSGCVPSKALLRVAKVAHTARTAAEYGIRTPAPVIDMPAVRDYLQRTIQAIYRHETPEVLRQQGIEVFLGGARFLDPHTVLVGERKIRGKKFLLATGAGPYIPAIPGLVDVAFQTYERIFENDRLPERVIILGAGATGVEIGQAYQRLGSQVSLIDTALLPQLSRDVALALAPILAGEGLAFVAGLATAARQEADEIVVTCANGEVRGDMLLLATGRRPNVSGLNLEKAGVAFSEAGIQVDKTLRTTAGHIYAAGDCLGGPQFTHWAGWQAFQATRNALLPGSENGLDKAVPFTIFTDPEIAQVGLNEEEARAQFGTAAKMEVRLMNRSDRAITDNRPHGFIKVMRHPKGRIVGATIVANRAGELISEYALAVEKRLKPRDLTDAIHTYPSYGTDTMLVCADAAVDDLLQGFSGRLLRRLAGGREPVSRK